MARTPTILDAYGRPVRRSELTTELMGPTTTGVRSPLTGYPGDGLDPRRLANILREADQGDPIRFLELAEVMEERDPHYLGVLGTRRRSVTQLDITVEDGGDSEVEQDAAKMVRDWLRRDELTEELFDILDSIGKGYSFTEILWDHSTGQWTPERLTFRDPRWFTFDRADLQAPLMLDGSGQPQPLPGAKFIFANIKAKSGIPTRSGLARVVTWCYLFTKYTERDWSIFTQTYGQPLRLGRFPPHSSQADRDTLFKAVANIAGDCAAIIPEGMQIEFVKGDISGSSDLYRDRADWYEKRISKAVLGQTATTDAVTGGLGSGKEHRQVQEDIETADARALAAILNRDLIRPWVDLTFGKQARYPKLVIARPEAEDLAALAQGLGPFIDRGMAVPTSWVRAKFGAPEPETGDQILRPTGQNAPAAPPAAPAPGDNAAGAGIKPPFNTQPAPARGVAAMTAQGVSAGRTAPLDIAADQLAVEARPAMARMMAQIEAMVAAADSLDQLQATLLTAYPDVPTDALTAIVAQALVAGDLAGRDTTEGDPA